MNQEKPRSLNFNYNFNGVAQDKTCILCKNKIFCSNTKNDNAVCIESYPSQMQNTQFGNNNKK